MGLGLFGLVVAVVVYTAIGERRTAAPVARPSRLDPRSIIESAGAAFQQFRAARQDYVIEAERQLTYEGGATKFLGVTVRVRNRGGRDFTVSGREAQATGQQEELQITGDVVLTASDGFTVTADSGTFSQADSTVRVPGAVAFHKGAMSGSGKGMTYNQASDELSLADEARVTVNDGAGRPQTEFTSGAATLARHQKYLALEGNVHALRGGEVLEADHGLARLSNNEESVTFIELRGNARVSGGGAFDSMHARDIDLDYTDDGATLERVALRGGGGVVMSGDGEGTGGRQFIGDALDLALAPDGALTAAAGRGNVRVDLPASPGMAGRNIRAQTFEAAGEPGRGLTSARFTDGVEYREEGRARQPSRTAHSAALRLVLADDAVTSALFDGRVRFDTDDLQGSAAQAEYDPAQGTLRLSGADAGGGPRVANAEIQIEAGAIDVTLDGPAMKATGTVKTVLRPQTRRSAEGGRLPGLLSQAEPVNVTAAALEYEQGGKAVYSGGAALWQGETAVRGDLLTLDRMRGDLSAEGNARSNIVLETGVSVGRATEIRYDDAMRRIAYGPPAPASASGLAPASANGSAPASVGAPAPAVASQLSGPQGDLRARRIELILAKAASRLDRLEAQTDVSVRLDTRVATGDRLTYGTEDERYVMTGIATVPVRIVEECRETSGRTVTFFRTSDRIVVDGNEEVRTQSSRGGPCPPPTTR